VIHKPKGQDKLVVADDASNPWGLVLSEHIDDMNTIDK
jgi:hypothetical protein